MSKKYLLDGDNVLYHYFKDELIGRESEEGGLIVRHMIHDLSIWLPDALYQRIPVLLPFVVRDPSCRKSVNKKREEWGSCNSDGYFRDDNTIIKAIPRRFKIKGKNKIYSNFKMAKGFVASHVWRKLSSKSGLASRDPMTNSFVPNLVWLPRQLSKLTDREGSFAQRYLQALSISIFKNIRLPEKKSQFVNKIWKMLESTTDISINEEEKQGLNFFDMGEGDIQNKTDDLLSKIKMIRNPDKRKLYCSRYFETYKKLPAKTKASLVSKLSEYEKIVN